MKNRNVALIDLMRAQPWYISYRQHLVTTLGRLCKSDDYPVCPHEPMKNNTLVYLQQSTCTLCSYISLSVSVPGYFFPEHWIEHDGQIVWHSAYQT